MKKKVENQPKKDFALEKENFYLICLGCLIILIGFLLMTGGKSPDPNVFNEKEIFSFRRITLAPIVVLAGYIFIIFAIMKKPKEKKES
jgi:predicted ABC-type sugar transport system permease subunit